MNEQELIDLRTRLLAIGGMELVPPPGGEDNGISALLAGGEVMLGPVTFEEMEPSHCHANVARQWMARRAGLTGICYGYALGHDEKWRQHWWGELRDGGILETTVPRVIYFGMPLQDPDGVAREAVRNFGV